MRLTDEQIGAELRALRAEPDPSFAATLDRRANAGFPQAKRKAGDRGLTWKLLSPILVGLAGIAVVAVVISNNGGSRDFLSPTPENPPASRGVSGAAPETLGKQSGQAGLAAKVGSQISSLPAGSRPRNAHMQVQELSAALGLSTDAGKLQEAADGVIQVTNQYDGFVDSSDVHVGGTNGHAFFQLRLPAVHLREALDDLSDLGRVTTRDEGSTNVTGAYVDAGKAYREARAKVDSLVAQLRSATDPAEAASTRAQLITARQQLLAARQALRSVKGRVAYAPVSVQIRANGDGSWSIGDAANDAGDVLKAIAGGTLVTLAVLVPLAALLALMWFGAGVYSRRRREAALDR